jgi:hypothetical protein
MKACKKENNSCGTHLEKPLIKDYIQSCMYFQNNFLKAFLNKFKVDESFFFKSRWKKKKFDKLET